MALNAANGTFMALGGGPEQAHQAGTHAMKVPFRTPNDSNGTFGTCLPWTRAGRRRDTLRKDHSLRSAQ
ncbi:hypothetical protein BC739_002388 [Kutzneria viridogrisea]|uniref:Uncharacterized protein n=1 Tax=Kutzneria viridogrisea TaxID=47990 RepID=A0ABR6BE82_9PSEU|nr:hypothetical protein [Kutzneria viridogrisea]